MRNLILTIVFISFSTTCFSQAILMYFNGGQTINDIGLSWGTSSEINMDYFQIERSLDGINYSTIITAPALGSPSSTMSYVRSDTSTFADTCYFYRLKAIELGGNYQYLDTITVCFDTSSNSINENSQEIDFLIFPNPATGIVSIKSNAEIQEIRIYDCVGNLIIGFSNAESADLTNLTAGIYHIEIIGENFIGRKMIIKP